MAEIKVHVKDLNTLVLDEDAKCGDYINLSDIQKVDLSFIQDIINKEKNESYQRQINERYLAKLDLVNKENDLKLAKETSDLNDTIKSLENEIEALKATNASYIKELKLTNENKLKDETNKLKNEIDALNIKLDNANRNKELELENQKIKLREESLNAENKLKAENNTNILKLNERIRNLEAEISKNKELKELEITNKVNEEKNKLNETITLLNNQLKSFDLEKQLELAKLREESDATLNKEKNHSLLLEEELDRIKLQKSTLNVKMLGEELERWCNEEYMHYATCGFTNCTWEKDNDVIKDEGEAKGTKADYVFKSYLDANKSILLTSVCCEMKNEALNSSNKKRNSDHYQKLDKDRKKKDCEYALLISELEWDSQNDAPIKKVLEYEKMYVVRPQYFMTFLSLITSLANKYRDLLAKDTEAKLNLKTSIELMDDFNKLKEAYFDKPLKTLSAKMEAIQKASLEIEKQNNKIKANADEILESTIETIKAKIDTFEVKAKTLGRKLDKLN